MSAEGRLGALELWKRWGGLGSLERAHRLLSGCSEWSVVVWNGRNSSGFVWVLLGQNPLSGDRGYAQAIGGYWARGGEWLEVWRAGKGLSNEVVAQTKETWHALGCGSVCG